MNVLELLRPNVRAFTPYSSARSEAAGGAIMLNANESPWPPAGGEGLNRYPDPQPQALLARLAGLYGVAPEQLLVGRGSDEGIDLLLRAFCRPGQDAVVVAPPTFGMYAVSARLQDAAVIEAPLAAGDFHLDAAAVLARVTPAVKLIFVCSPNNPTGNAVPLAAIEQLAGELADRAVVVVDEAYVEFAAQPSATTLLARHVNLVVLRTLSKAWALAGARVGTLIACPELITALRAIMAPYPLPRPSIAAAQAALAPAGAARMREHVATLLAERARLAAALPALPGVRGVLPSSANFLAVRFVDAPATYRALAARGIIVRSLARYPGLADALRVSIGTAAENDALLAALATLAQEVPA